MFGFPATKRAFHPRRPVGAHVGGKPWTDGTIANFNGWQRLPDLQYDLAGLVWHHSTHPACRPDTGSCNYHIANRIEWTYLSAQLSRSFLHAS